MDAMDECAAPVMTIIASSPRLVLPFTHGVDATALEMAVLLAKNRRATLVPVAIIQASSFTRGARLEHIQQAKDFIVLLQSKAAKYGVVVEPHEVFTGDIFAHLHTVIKEHEGSGIILFVRDGDGVLLNASEVKHILAHVEGQHHIIRLHRGSRQALLNPVKRFIHIVFTPFIARFSADVPLSRLWSTHNAPGQD